MVRRRFAGTCLGRGRRFLLPEAALCGVGERVQAVLGGVAAALQGGLVGIARDVDRRSEEHTSELQSLMRISYAVFCLKKQKTVTTVIMMDKTRESDRTPKKRYK